MMESNEETPRNEMSAGATPREEAPRAGGTLKRPKVNVGTAERVASGIAGAILAGYGLKRKSLLGGALALVGGELIFRAASGHCPVYNALEVDTRERGEEESLEEFLDRRGINVARSVTVHRAPAELYAYWRDFRNLASFMDDVESVDTNEDGLLHWRVKGPQSTVLAWDAEIVDDRPDASIAWRSLPGGDVDTVGSVSFEPARGGSETVVRVEMRYSVPSGKIGATLSKLLGKDPSEEVLDGLRHFKYMMEAGQKPTTDGQPCGKQDASAAPERPRHFGFGSRDIVEQASWESFPASDPPAY